MTTVDRRPITDALLQMLRTATGMEIGDPFPDPAGIGDEEPWGALHSIDGGGFEFGSLRFPESDVQFVYQIDSVGRRRDHAEWMADLVRRTMIARSASGAFQVAFPNVTPWKVADRRPDTNPAGAIPEGEPSTRVYTISDRYVLSVTLA